MRTTVVGMALVVALGSPASAPRVEGGASFTDAPVLTPGRYRDTIRPTETLFYAVELLPGETLRAKVAVETFGDESFYADLLTLDVYSPARERIDYDLKNLHGGLERRVLRAGREADFSEGGTYYVSFDMPNQFGEQPRRREYRIALTLKKAGTPRAPSPTPAPTVTFASPTPEAAPPMDEPEGGSNSAGLLGAGAIAFVVGAVAGAARRTALGRGR